MNALLENPLMQLAAKNIQKKDPYDHFEKNLEIRVAQEELREYIINKSALFQIFGDNLFGMVRTDNRQLTLDINMIDLMELDRAEKMTRQRIDYVHFGMRRPTNEEFTDRLFSIAPNAMRDYIHHVVAKAQLTREEKKKQELETAASKLVFFSCRDGRYMYIPKGKEQRELYEALEKYAERRIWCKYIEEEVPLPEVNPLKVNRQLAVQNALRNWFK